MPSPTSTYPAYPNPYPYPKQAAALFPVWQYAEVFQLAPITILRKIYGYIKMYDEHKNMRFRVRDIAKLFKTDYRKLYRCMVGIDELLTRKDLMFRFNITYNQIRFRSYPKGIRYRNTVRYFAQETIEFHLRRYA